MTELAIAAVLAAIAAWCVIHSVRWLRDFGAEPAWPELLRGLGRFALAAWFLYWAVDATWSIPNDGRMGVDGRIYYRAAVAWVNGADPWSAGVEVSGLHFDFAGPPPTVLAFVPFAPLPEEIFNAAWLAISLAAAVFTIRRLKLPPWWLLFPPVAQAVMVGNPQVVCLAALVAGSELVATLAVPLKAYAALPLAGELRWRPLAYLALACGVSFLLWPDLWRTYVAGLGAISQRLAEQSSGGFSATRDVRLLVPTVVALAALAIVDRRAAGWLAVPGAWPSSQFFYAAFALPVITPLFAAVLAAGSHPETNITPLAVIAFAAWRVAERAREPVRRLVRNLQEA